MRARPGNVSHAGSACPKRDALFLQKAQGTELQSSRWRLAVAALLVFGGATCLLAVLVLVLQKKQSSQGNLRQTFSLENCPAGDRQGIFPSKQSALFERLLSDPPYRLYNPVALSRDPWVLQFDHFLSAEESMALVQSCPEFKPDVTADERLSKKYRNSSSFNCKNRAQAELLRKTDCDGIPAFRRYRERMSSMLGIGLQHSEGVSVLKYQPGGFYRKHHDFMLPLHHPDHENCGPRVLTFMTYLTDVEEGGETSFFHLDIKVVPKVGRAILFADTFDHAPMEKDERTAHEALVVRKGTKYTATSWFAMYDRDANLQAHCCGHSAR